MNLSFVNYIYIYCWLYVFWPLGFSNTHFVDAENQRNDIMVLFAIFFVR